MVNANAIETAVFEHQSVDCTRAEEDIFNYSLDLSEGTPNPDLKEHIERCPRCSNILNGFLELENAVGQIKNSPQSNSGKRKTFLAPEKIGDFPVVGLIAEGGMGTVWKARDPALDRFLAIKVMKDELSDNTEFSERFTAEARIVARLNHPNIVQVHSVGRHEGRLFIAMEYVEGEVLAARLGQRLELDAAVGIFRHIAEGIKAAHENQIVHRDIKPANIMITVKGAVKILDFGLSKALCANSDQTTTAQGTVLGTIAYLAPEVACGKRATFQSDVYALGLVFFQMLTGRPVFPETSTPLELIERIKNDSLPRPSQINSAVPSYLDNVVQKMCAKDPARRYASVAAVLEDLDARQVRAPASPEPSIRPAAVSIAEAVPDPAEQATTPNKSVILIFLLLSVSLAAAGVWFSRNPFWEGHIMDNIFQICAVVGGTVFVCQLILMVLGFHGDHELGGFHDGGHAGSHDIHHGPHSSNFFGMLTFRTMVVAVTFFGLSGMAASAGAFSGLICWVIAFVSGVAAMFIMGSMMSFLYRLRDDGTARIEQAVGKSGTVYLTIPAGKSGVGKVTLSLQNRTVEYLAVTAADALQTGSKIVVVDVVTADTLEVAPATNEK